MHLPRSREHWTWYSYSSRNDPSIGTRIPSCLSAVLISIRLSLVLLTFIVPGIVFLVCRAWSLWFHFSRLKVHFSTLLIVLLASYKEIATYATIEDLLELLTFSLYVLSYVDDNSLLTSLDHNWDMTKILTLVESNLLHWRNLLRLTGGIYQPTYSVVLSFDSLYNVAEL